MLLNPASQAGKVQQLWLGKYCSLAKPPVKRILGSGGAVAADSVVNSGLMLLVQGRLRRHSVAPGHSYIDQCGNHDNNGKYNRKRRDSSPREHASSMPKAAAAGSVENYL